MDPDRLEKLTRAGIDVFDALRRFRGNEALLERLLKKFPGDRSFYDLCSAVDSGDVEAARAAAHTLKGVSASLSMTELCALLTWQTGAYRANRPDIAANLMPSVKTAYEKVVSVIDGASPPPPQE